MQASVVEPVDVFERGELHLVGVAPRSPPADQLGLEEADRGLGHGVVERVTDGAHREKSRSTRSGGRAASSSLASAPNRLWLADLTYVRTWAGFCYVAFVEDAFSQDDRRVVPRHAPSGLARDRGPGDGGVEA